MKTTTLDSFKKIARWTLLSTLAGALAGTAATVFLQALNFITVLRLSHPQLLWLLPVGGLVIGWTFHHYGKHVNEGTHLILEEIHQPQKTVPLSMAPWIFFGTLLTHLFGGSAGREGTVVQMGASLADQLSRVFAIPKEQRQILLMAGAGAGFGAALGTPWAGMIFGMEVIHIGRLRLFAWLECLVCAWSAYAITQLLQAPHSHFPGILEFSWSADVFFRVAMAGVLFGLCARLFMKTTHAIELLQMRLFRYPPLRTMAAGALLLLFYQFSDFSQYAGLGIEQIQQSFSQTAALQNSALKLLFSSLTIGSGFKGGEFIPLVYIGSNFGSYLSTVLHLPLSLLEALGFAAVFAAASKTPWACSLMAAEIFGWKILPFALLACFCSYYFSGPKSIYKKQKWLDRGRPFFTRKRKSTNE